MSLVNKIRREIIILLLIMVLVTSSLVLPAKAITVISVDYIMQENTNWCWAATAQMVGRHFYPTSSITQTQIVEHVKGAVVNQPADIYETADGTMYVTYDTFTFGGATGAFSFASVKQYINAGLPIQPLVNDGNTGHYYVIYGYHEANSVGYLYLVDPGDGHGKYVSYYDFLDGNWTETRPWIASVL